MARPREQRELEEKWRLAVQRARQNYITAVNEFCQALEDRGTMAFPDSSLSVSKARTKETAALSEYRRVLEVFSQLLGGTIPQEDPPDD
jgi:hypothetical protein